MTEPDPPAFTDATRVEPIVLDDRHGRWQFEPQPDITPYEAALIGQLFITLVLRQRRLDWREYLTRKWDYPIDRLSTGHVDLARHFKDIG